MTAHTTTVSVHFLHACSSRIGRDLFSPTNFESEDTRCPTNFEPLSVTARLFGASTPLREELDLNQAVDVFCFYFGYFGLFTLHDENGWSYERAERWLCREASRALLRDYTPH